MSSAKTNAPDFESYGFDGADVHREDACVDSLEVQFDHLSLQQAESDRQHAVLQHAVDTCLASCLATIDALYITREDCGVSEVAIAHNSWQQEAEPQPCGIDSWLRGVIPEEQRVPSPSALSVQTRLTATTSRRDQSLSGTPRRLGTTSTIQANDQESLTRSSTAKTGSKPTSSQSARRETIIRNSPASASAKKLTPEQKEAEDRLRDELTIRRQQAAVAKQLKQQDDEARAQTIAMQKDLKGKDYSYDSHGKVVMLNKVNPEQLPHALAPQVHVATVQGDTVSNASPAKSGGSNKAASKQLGPQSGSTLPKPSAATSHLNSTTAKSTKSTLASTAGKDFIQTAAKTQPSALETIKLGAGVTLRSGPATKQGPRREGSQGQLTRQQFQQQAKASNGRPRPVARAAASSVAGDKPAAPSRAAPGSAHHPSAGGVERVASATPAALLASLPPSPPTPLLGATRKAADITVRPVSPDVNLALVSAPDWGACGIGSYEPPEPMPHVKPAGIKDLAKEGEAAIRVCTCIVWCVPACRGWLAVL